MSPLDPSAHPPRRVTLKDVARAVGLSHAAVSLALRNSPEIAVATRERIQAVAKEIGYTPNPMAAGLAQFRRNAAGKPVQAGLAWVNCWPDPKDLWRYKEFAHYWEGASGCAERFGFRLEEFQCNGKTPPQRLQQILLARGIRGILIAPEEADAPAMDWSGFDWGQFSTVRLGRRPGPPCVQTVAPAQTTNAMLAVEKMREKGYRRIGFVGSPWKTWTYGAGFLWAEAIENAGAPPMPPFFTSGEKHRQAAFAAWLREMKPDAILTERPEVPKMLVKAGYRVPEGMGLAALTVLDCPIDAGIDQKPDEIGRVAVLMLISLLRDNDCGIPSIQHEILIKGAWVDGSSLPVKSASF